MKIKIIKEREGLPPVETMLSKSKGGDFKDTLNPLGYTYCLGPTLISLALEAGYAEEIKEPWQAWERVKKYEEYFYIRDDLNLGIHRDVGDSIDNSLFNSGNYFPDIAAAEEAAKRVRDALREFHEESESR